MTDTLDQITTLLIDIDRLARTRAVSAPLWREIGALRAETAALIGTDARLLAGCEGSA